MLFLVFLFRVFSFSIFVTGFCGLLNYLFDWHLSLEGTEAPSDIDGVIILICISITLLLWGELIAKNHYIIKFINKWYSVVFYLLISTLISTVPILNYINGYKNYEILHDALTKNHIAKFQDKENLRKLSQKDLARIFSQSIRLNSPEIGNLIAEFLNDAHGEKDSPNIFLAAYRCNPKIFEILVNKNVNFSLKEKYMGNSVAHSIVTGIGNVSDKIKVIQMLAEKKLIDIDSLDNFQISPLMIAVDRGEHELVEALLSLKADFSKVDHVGNPVLTRACELSSVYPNVNEEDRIQTSKILLKYGLDKFSKDYLGRDCPTLAKENKFLKLEKFFRE
ncbi:MAG: ankyrin repeat domain-containing protein [Leptospiraceae bacterium]|nr:ankyrin repeat domain-containing protein [Leptospiraceae bacterium]